MLSLNNNAVEQIFVDCDEEIKAIENRINTNKFDSLNQYLIKYCLIKVCGTLEQGFKTIVADALDRDANDRMKKYISKEIRESSKNPSYANICSLLKSVEPYWQSTFKTTVQKEKEKDSSLLNSLESLNDSRNSLAHGLNISITIDEIMIFFDKSKKIIKLLDASVLEEETNGS